VLWVRVQQSFVMEDPTMAQAGEQLPYQTAVEEQQL
jgi:hypothetical protein